MSPLDWRTATMDEIDAHLQATADRQRAAFPAPTAASYAAEQRAPDAEDTTEDLG